MNPSNGFPPKLEFELNVPRILAMAYAEGKPCNSRSGDSLMWTTTAGERFFTDPYVGDRARAAGLVVGVPMEWEKTEIRQGNRRIVEFHVRKLSGAGTLRGSAPAPAAQETSSSSQPNPTPAPPALPVLAPAPVNGAGATSADIMARCYRQAIDIAVGAVAYAQEKGLRITPEFANIQALAATICINEGGRR